MNKAQYLTKKIMEEPIGEYDSFEEMVQTVLERELKDEEIENPYLHKAQIR